MRKISLKEQKELSLDILVYFDSICREKGLRYFLGYGTLLGAVRHKGYIPWDDDIDVMMPRKDFEKLLKVFPEHSYYKINYNTIDPLYGKSFAVINDTRTIKVEKLLREKCKKSICVNIDIFPLDVMPDSFEKQKQIFAAAENIDRKLACLTYAYGSGRTIFSTIKKNLGILFYRIGECLGLTSIRKVVNENINLMKSYNKDNNNTIASLTYIGRFGLTAFMPKKCFDENIQLEFEGRSFYAPKDFDEVLTHLYGDYMTLPPAEKRVQHSSDCYWV